MLACEFPVCDPVAGSLLYRDETKDRRKGSEQFGVTKEVGSPSSQAAALCRTQTLFPSHPLCFHAFAGLFISPFSTDSLQPPAPRTQTSQPGSAFLGPSV